jgi:hypothetical protein
MLFTENAANSSLRAGFAWRAASFQLACRCHRAFSSEVDTGSREEKASK